MPGSIKPIGDAPTGLHHVALPNASGAAKKPYALYAMAGASIVVGVLGLAFGMRGGSTSRRR